MADLFKEILPDINYGHTNLIRTDDMDEAEYGRNCFIINRALSMNIDTILYVNEIAPRVHNSGHLTINSHNISQFENHIRAVCGLEKKETKKLFNAKMINLIGNDILIYRNKKFNKNEFFFDYQKKEVKPKRKMGHFKKIIK